MVDSASTAGISRSGRVRKKSAKLKEMEDIEIPEFDLPAKGRKRKGFEDSDYELDDKRVAPIKIPKISLSLSSKKKNFDMQHSPSKNVPFPSPVKGRLEPNRPLFQDSAADSSDASEGSSSGSSETSSSSSSSSSSSDESDAEADAAPELSSDVETKPIIVESNQRYSMQHVQSHVDSYVDFHSDSYVDPNSDMAAYGSEGETSESALVIAEESNDQSVLGSKAKKVPDARKRPVKKPAAKQPLSQVAGKGVQKPKPGSRPPPKKKDKTRSRPMSAYMLWCAESRKRIVAQTPDLGFSAISKKLGEMWQSLPDKEKMAWRRKAKKNAMKSSGLISTGKPSEQSVKVTDSSPTLSDDLTRGSLDSNRTVGTSPIDVAAYLKLLGESLSIIGQRLTEHEGQIAVSGSLSVLLDSTVCALGPLLCLTLEVPEINGCTQETLSQALDNIAYMMPGL